MRYAVLLLAIALAACQDKLPAEATNAPKADPSPVTLKAAPATQPQGLRLTGSCDAGKFEILVDSSGAYLLRTWDAQEVVTAEGFVRRKSHSSFLIVLPYWFGEMQTDTDEDSGSKGYGSSGYKDARLLGGPGLRLMGRKGPVGGKAETHETPEWSETFADVVDHGGVGIPHTITWGGESAKRGGTYRVTGVEFIEQPVLPSILGWREREFPRHKDNDSKYENGSPKLVWSYAGDMPVSCKAYREDGTLEAEETYTHGILARKVAYHPNGKPWIDTTFDLRTQHSTAFSAEGIKESEIQLACRWTRHESGWYKYFHRNGQVGSHWHVNDGKKNGLSEQWSQDGRLLCRGEYRDGQPYSGTFRETTRDMAGHVTERVWSVQPSGKEGAKGP